MMKHLLLMAAALLAMASCIKDNDGDEGGKIVAGDSVPAFVIESADGSESFNSTELASSVLIYLFWSECSACKEQTPAVKTAWESAPNIKLIPIARGGGESATLAQAETYWASTGIAVPFYYDSDRSIFNLFASANVPRFYLVDAAGVVRWASNGGEVVSAENILKAIAAL